MGKNEFNRDDYVSKVNKNLKRLFFNKGVLNNDEGKAFIDTSVNYYVDKLGQVSSPAHISSIIYSEYALKHLKRTVTNGYSALWNAVFAAFRRGFVALPAAIVVMLTVSAVVAACIAVVVAVTALFALAAAGGLLYIIAGIAGFAKSAATGLAFSGIGLMAIGGVVLLYKPMITFAKKSGEYISLPVFALGICVRQYARSKRI